MLHIPPDPIGAAGPSHVVNIVNCSIEWYTKAGIQQNSQSNRSFFTSLGPTTDTFDPKVIYDQYAGRFVVVDLERTPSPQTSTIFLAVSDDSDPNGTWYYQSINSLINVSGTNYWADYPGFAVDDKAIYVTANMFDFSNNFLGTRLWIIDKFNPGGGLYGSGTSTVNIYDPATSVGAGGSFTFQPSHMFGTPPGSMGSFLVNLGTWVFGTSEALMVIRIDNPIGATSFSVQFMNCGDIHSGGTLPDAPQLGTATTIEVNDPRSLHAVWRNNNLWTCNTIEPNSGPDAGQTTAHWYRVDTSSLAALSLADQGDVGAEDIAGNTFTFFPSIAVDGADRMGIGFAASAATIYCGAYYTGRLPTDPAGTVQATGTVQVGADYYIRAFGGTRNRWGDYSGIAVDPVDDATFWVFNEYAMTRGTLISGEDGRWATHWGSWTFGPVPVELSSFLASATESGVQLEWRTVSESDNLGFNVYRAIASDGPRELLNNEILPGAGIFDGLNGTVKVCACFLMDRDDLCAGMQRELK